MACTSHVTAYIAHNVYNLGIRTQHQYDRNSHCRNKNTKHRTEPMARKALYSRNSQTENGDNTQRSHRHQTTVVR